MSQDRLGAVGSGVGAVGVRGWGWGGVGVKERRWYRECVYMIQ